MQGEFTSGKWCELIPPSEDDWQLIVKILNEREQSQLAPPFIISIAGSVSAGKSTFAEKLRQELLKNNSSKNIAVISADSFLMSNSILKAKNLMDEKGFPSSFDWQKLADFLKAVKSRQEQVPYQVYSHELSDLSDEIKYVERPDILIIEGINMLQEAPNSIISPSNFVDFGIYLDASEADLEDWYMERYHRMLEINYDNPGNFFYHWAHESQEVADAFAHDVWKKVNLKNLREYIAPTKEKADLIIQKQADHSVSKMYLRENKEEK